MLQKFKYIYFIGIGGIGMSAIARWFNTKGYQVAGYDKTATPLTNQLTAEGMLIHFQDDITSIPPEFIKNKETTLVVYTPAIPANHHELNYFKAKGFILKKRAEVLGLLTKDFFTIAVAGTHGKTTTSSMIAHILQNSEKSCTAFLGGILQNYDSNLLLSKHTDKDEIMVVEADEYDKSFLHLYPNVAIVTSMDEDHLEIYGNKKHIIETFVEFAKKIQQNGRLFIKKGLALWQNDIERTVLTEDYVLDYKADHYAKNIFITQGCFHFDYVGEGKKIQNIELYIPGFHNVENAIAAIATCLYMGIQEDIIRKAIASYKGVKRRFEYVIKREDKVFIDDYAHHPEEVKALLTSVKAMYPEKKITTIFQPHLYTRTKDFADDFAKSLSLTDELVILDIYPARELPIEGVTSQIILDKVTISQKTLCSKEKILNFLKDKELEVLVTAGAGDIAHLVEKIKDTIA